MQRKQTWPEDLHDHFMEHAQKPFEWGTTDCLLHVSNAIHAMTGIDVAEEFRGKYDSEFGALRAIKEYGCESFEEVVDKITAKHAMQEIGVKFAQRGDVVVFDTAEGVAFGVVHHNGRDAVCAGPKGLRRLCVINARRAWRV